MSGICSAHRGHDDDCRLCIALPLAKPDADLLRHLCPHVERGWCYSCEELGVENLQRIATTAADPSP